MTDTPRSATPEPHPWENHDDSCECHIGICMDCGCTNEVRSIPQDDPAAGWSVEERQGDDGSWSVVSTALPGLVVAGATREEAWRQWPEAVESWASTANEGRVKAERARAAERRAVLAELLDFFDAQMTKADWCSREEIYAALEWAETQGSATP